MSQIDVDSVAVEKPDEAMAAFRRACLDILGKAFQARLDSQRLVWKARAEVGRLEDELGRARVRLEAEERELVEAREVLMAVWRDVRTPEKTLMSQPDAPTDS